MVGGRAGPSLSPPLPSRLCFNIRALAMAVFMQALSCFSSSPLVPSCPPAARKQRTGGQANRARGLDRTRAPEALASKKKCQNRGARRLGSRSGSGSVGSGTLASIIRLFSSASIPGPARPRSGLVCQRPAGIPIRDIKFNAPQQAARRRHTRQVPVIDIHDVTSLH